MWQIAIEPGHGSYVGLYDNGNCAGMFIEAELTKKLGDYISEELNHSRIRNVCLNYVRNQAPTMMNRVKDVDPTSILVSLHFEKYRGITNKSVVYYNKNPYSEKLARWLIDPLEKWGKQCCARYDGCYISDGNYPIFNRDAPSVVVSPCSLSAEDTLLYIQRLVPLSKILAHSIANWAASQNPGIRWADPYRGQAKTSKKV